MLKTVLQLNQEDTTPNQGGIIFIPETGFQQEVIVSKLAIALAQTEKTEEQQQICEKFTRLPLESKLQKLVFYKEHSISIIVFLAIVAPQQLIALIDDLNKQDISAQQLERLLNAQITDGTTATITMAAHPHEALINLIETIKPANLTADQFINLFTTKDGWGRSVIDYIAEKHTPFHLDFVVALKNVFLTDKQILELFIHNNALEQLNPKTQRKFYQSFIIPTLSRLTPNDLSMKILMYFTSVQCHIRLKHTLENLSLSQTGLEQEGKDHNTALGTILNAYRPFLFEPIEQKQAVYLLKKKLPGSFVVQPSMTQSNLLYITYVNHSHTIEHYPIDESTTPQDIKGLLVMLQALYQITLLNKIFAFQNQPQNLEAVMPTRSASGNSHIIEIIVKFNSRAAISSDTCNQAARKVATFSSAFQSMKLKRDAFLIYEIKRDAILNYLKQHAIRTNEELKPDTLYLSFDPHKVSRKICSRIPKNPLQQCPLRQTAQPIQSHPDVQRTRFFQTFQGINHQQMQQLPHRQTVQPVVHPQNAPSWAQRSSSYPQQPQVPQTNQEISYQQILPPLQPQTRQSMNHLQNDPYGAQPSSFGPQQPQVPQTTQGNNHPQMQQLPHRQTRQSMNHPQNVPSRVQPSSFCPQQPQVPKTSQGIDHPQMQQLPHNQTGQPMSQPHTQILSPQPLRPHSGSFWHHPTDDTHPQPDLPPISEKHERRNEFQPG